MVAVEKINGALLELRASRGALIDGEAAQRRRRRAPELLDILVRYEYERCVSVDRPSFDAPSEQLDVDLVAWCWRCASAAYGFTMLKGLGLLRGVLPASMGDVLQLDDVAIHHRCGSDCVVLKRSIPKAWTTTPWSPAYFVAYSPSRAAVVVSLRGTADVGDALTDLVCAASRLRDGRLAHSGMAEAADCVLAETADVIAEALASAPDGVPLVFTGHSMGGGVALLAASKARDCKVLCPHLESHPIKVVAFAPPPVVSDDAAEHDLVSLFVEDDVVPNLSLRSVADLVRELDAIDAALKPRYRLELVLAAKAASSALFAMLLDDFEAWADRQRKRLIDAVDGAIASDARPPPTAPPLKIPGTVFRLSRNGTCAKLSSNVVPRIRIMESSFMDHLPPTLETAINALLSRR